MSAILMDSEPVIRTATDARALAACKSLATMPGFSREAVVKREDPDKVARRERWKDACRTIRKAMADPPPPVAPKPADIMREAWKEKDMQSLIAVVCQRLGTTTERFMHRKRFKEVSQARTVVYYILRERDRMSYPAIARKMGGMCHSSIVVAVRRAERMFAA